MPTIRVEGRTPPPTMLPGTSTGDPIRDRIARETQSDAAWARMTSPGSATVDAHLAAHAQRNQQAVGTGTGTLNLPGVAGRSLPPPPTQTGMGGASTGSSQELLYLRDIDIMARAQTNILLRDEARQQMRPSFMPPNAAMPPGMGPAFVPPGAGQPGAAINREADFERRERDVSQAHIKRLDYEKRQEELQEQKDREVAAVRGRRQYTEDRMNAEGENRQRDSAYRAQRTAAEFENKERDQTRSGADARMRSPFGARGALTGPRATDRWPGGGGDDGDGGGGGGGGSGGGGGWGRSVGGPIGFGSTFEAGFAALTPGKAIPAILAFEAVKELMLAPQVIGGAEARFLGAAGPSMRYQNLAYTMGQAGGFSANDMMDRLYNGGIDWQRRTGVGRDEALQMVRRLGITPRSSRGANSLAETLSMQRITPGLSYVPEDMRLGFQANMLALGVNSGTELTSNGMTHPTAAVPQIAATMKDIMLQTAQTGQASLRVLQSIDTGVSTLSSMPTAGTALNPQNLFDLNQRFLSLPEGRTGEAGTRAIATTQSRLMDVGRNPTMTVLGSQLQQRLRTPEDLSRFFSKNPRDAAAWQAYAASESGQSMINRYFQAVKGGESYAAAIFLGQGILQDPNLSGTRAVQDYMIHNSLTAGLGPGLGFIAGANTSGKTLAEADAFLRSETNEDARMAVVQAARGTGVPSTLALAVAQIESNMNPLAQSSAGAQGLMQLMPGTARHMGLRGGDVWDPKKNAAGGVGYLQEMLTRFGGDRKMALEAYNWGPGHEADIRAGRVLPGVAAYANNVMNLADRLNQAGGASGMDEGNIPSYLPAIGTAKSGVLSASTTTLTEGKYVLDAWAPVVDAVDRLANAIRAAVTSTSPASAASSAPH